jgi:hypothetical protein
VRPQRMRVCLNEPSLGRRANCCVQLRVPGNGFVGLGLTLIAMGRGSVDTPWRLGRASPEVAVRCG